MKRILAYLLSISLILLPMPPMVQAEETQVVVASGTIAANVLKASLVDGGATASGGAFADFTALTATDSVPVASGTVAQANVRIATVATGALLELVGVDLSAHLNKKIVIRSGGKRLEGYIGAAGGETLSGELSPDSAFDVDAAWQDISGLSITGGKAVFTGVGTGNAAIPEANNITDSVGKLYKLSATCDSLTSGTWANRLFGVVTGATRTETGTFTDYLTASVAGSQKSGIIVVSTLTASFTDNSTKRVTDVAVTGAKIYTNSSLATQSWAYQDTGYDPNAAAGVTYEIYSVTPLTNHLGHLVRFKSLTSGQVLQGMVKAVGAGLSKQAAKNVVSITKANPGVVTFSAGHGYVNGDLIYFSGLTEMTSLNGQYRTLHSASGDTFQIGSTAAETAAETTGGSCAEKVLVPANTGATITSTKGGATYNWSAKPTTLSTFLNDAAGYSYEIIRILDAPVVDSDVVANADATIVMTAGSAAWSATGIDDSAYQDGKHIIHITDQAGVVAYGYYKSGGAGAVVNAKSGATQNWLNIGAGFSTAGDFTRKVLYVGD